MKKLRLLSVSFDTHLNPWELNRFRGAVAHKVGLEHEWFHNHNNTDGGYHHRYPLIQYKIDSHRGQMRPMLLCLDNCIEEAHHFFSQSDWSLRIGSQVHDMRIARLHVDQINLNVWENFLPYRLHKWRALNSDNFRTWQNLDGVAEKFLLLENVLAANILSFARGVGWTLDKRFEVKITKLVNEEWVSVKDIKMLSLSVEFKANVSLPEFIGLGQGAGEGFGVVRRQQRQAATRYTASTTLEAKGG